MANFVLVHGAWGGAHSYGEVPELLSAAGHRVCLVHLRGLGSRQGELHGGITLSDHVADVVEQTEAAGFDRFILAGHSYGGMVISGVAAQLGARIDAICYIDAFLPDDDQSLWDITGEQAHRGYIDGQKHTPGLVAPLGQQNFEVVPGKRGYHPLLTLLEAVKFTGQEALIPRRAYVFAAGYDNRTFAGFAQRTKSDPAWEYHELPTTHSVMAEMPQETVQILLGLQS